MANELLRNKNAVIRITQKNKAVIDTSYTRHGNTLDNVDTSKYLGVTISNCDNAWHGHSLGPIKQKKSNH